MRDSKFEGMLDKVMACANDVRQAQEALTAARKALGEYVANLKPVQAPTDKKETENASKSQFDPASFDGPATVGSERCVDCRYALIPGPCPQFCPSKLFER